MFVEGFLHVKVQRLGVQDHFFNGAEGLEPDGYSRVCPQFPGFLRTVLFVLIRYDVDRGGGRGDSAKLGCSVRFGKRSRLVEC